MNKKYIPFVVIFALILLLPFTVQTVADLRGEKRFVSLDIFKDVFFTPFKRESSLNGNAKILRDAWRNARESIAGGADAGVALEPVVSALADLEATAFTVNAYAELDSGSREYKLLKHADSLVLALEDEPETFAQVDSVLKKVVDVYKDFSLYRSLSGVKRYGAWSGKYLRAFEKKVEDENAMVLALRPKYQLAVWNIFRDPGEKVVLGSGRDGAKPWLYYRQDVEFLVQPSPLDKRSAKLDNPIRSIEKFRWQLKERGVELMVVVVPGKPSIYPERLTGVAADSMRLGHGKKILDSLASLGFQTVDLYGPLWNAKADDEKYGALYLDDDTHWTPRGAELAAKVIADKVLELAGKGVIHLGEASAEYAVSDSLADRMGDIGEMSGLNKFHVFSAQQVKGHVVSLLMQDSTCAPFKDDFRKSEILILGDSFSRIYQTDTPVNAGWIAHFAKNLGRPVASIVSDGGASTLVREKLARKAGVLKGKKLLIWEFVERDLRFGAEGWKTVEF